MMVRRSSPVSQSMILVPPSTRVLVVQPQNPSSTSNTRLGKENLARSTRTVVSQRVLASRPRNESRYPRAEDGVGGHGEGDGGDEKGRGNGKVEWWVSGAAGSIGEDPHSGISGVCRTLCGLSRDRQRPASTPKLIWLLHAT